MPCVALFLIPQAIRKKFTRHYTKKASWLLRREGGQMQPSYAGDCWGPLGAHTSAGLPRVAKRDRADPSSGRQMPREASDPGDQHCPAGLGRSLGEGKGTGPWRREWQGFPVEERIWMPRAQPWFFSSTQFSWEDSGKEISLDSSPQTEALWFTILQGQSSIVCI